MNLRWRRWAPVLAAALGFAVLAWLVASASLSGSPLLSKAIPPGLPPELLAYVPDDFVDDFPADADLTADSSREVSQELLDRLGRELSVEELVELSGALSDEAVVDLAQQKLLDLSPEELQRIWDNLDWSTQQRLLDSLEGRYTQSQLDLYADKLSPELYEELEKRTRPEPEPDPDSTGDTSPDPETSEEPTSSPSPSASSSPAQPSASATDAADDEKESDPWAWLATLGDFLLFAVKWLLILGVVAVLGYVAYRVISALTGWRPGRRRGRTEPEKPAETAEPGPEVAALREAVADGLSDIADSADPRRGVIACWQRLEQAAASVGVTRRAAETPGELVTRVLTSANVDPDTLTGLADIYRRARYGPHAIDEDLRRQAVAALAALDAQLAATATTAATT